MIKYVMFPCQLFSFPSFYYFFHQMLGLFFFRFASYSVVQNWKGFDSERKVAVDS